MKNAALNEVVVAGGHLDRVGDQTGAHVVGHRVADDLAVEAVDHGGYVQPALPGRDVGNVPDQLGAWGVGGEVAAHQVRDRRRLLVGGGGGLVGPWLAGHQAQFAHQPPDQLVADLLAATQQFGVHTPVAVGGVGGVEQGLDLDLEQLAAGCGGAGRPGPPLVEAGPGHAQPAEHLADGGSRADAGVVLGVDELILFAHRGSLAKYAAAFFRNAFSISRSRLRRSSSRSRARSDNSNGGSSPACSSRYARSQFPSVVSLTLISRATSAIERLESMTMRAASSRNSGLNLRYFPATTTSPFRNGTYLVRSPEGGRQAIRASGCPGTDCGSRVYEPSMRLVGLDWPPVDRSLS